MEELIPFNTEIVGSGSNSLPVFCGWFQGKHNPRGKKFIIRILGKNANFHREILSEVTPQLTNNCSQIVLFEVAFKFGNIYSNRLSELFIEQYPMYQNNIPEL